MARVRRSHDAGAIAQHDRQPDLSIIIPAFNEERRLPRTLERIRSFLDDQPFQAEIVVVENGSTDGAASVVERVARRDGRVRLIRSPRRGKGLAIKLGLLEARGRYRFLCDADLSMPIEQLMAFFCRAEAGSSLVIGSREGLLARRVGEPVFRHVMGRLFAGLVKLLVLPGFDDTQCGFKLIRGEVVPTLCACLTMEGWAFDVELLVIARRHGYGVAQVPIAWHFDGDSRVRPVRDALQMVRDTLRIRRNDRRGHYGQPAEPRRLSQALAREQVNGYDYSFEMDNGR